MSEKALVALGSNATSRHGSPREVVEAALHALDAGAMLLRDVSALYLTPFVPPGREPDVVNAVALVETALTPSDLLDLLQRIEAAFDRERAARWTSRTLDLDLIAMGERVLPDRETVRAWMDMAPGEQERRAPDMLILPHPRMHERAFVLVPACEVLPDWRHPITGQTIRAMRDGLPESEVAAVRPLGPGAAQ